jgi:predicted DNA-binding protein (MmcQ/YjbR family)
VSDPSAVREQIREFSLGLPGAWEDHPWNESVVKVGKKIFVFLGMEEGVAPGFGVKLGASNLLALAQAGVKPSGYGLGKAGWVSVDLTVCDLPAEMLLDWVVESYRIVAPKRLAAELASTIGAADARGEGR